LHQLSVPLVMEMRPGFGWNLDVG